MTETVTRFVREMMHISDNVFYISLAFLLLVLCLIIVYWFYTRKKMQDLKHQVPATVLKNYLDSVIQNSNALKSSLFRGGGLDAAEGIPSIVPAGNLPSGNVGVGGSEDLSQKNAEIAALHGQLGTKDTHIRDLEKQLSERVVPSGDSSEEVQIMQSELDKLRGDLGSKQSELDAALAANVGGGEGGGAEVEALQKEKSELQDRLKEYEIIEEDLANLRRLQQENEQLKQTIDQLEGGAPAAPAAEAPAPTPEPEAAPEPAPEPEPAVEEPAAPSADEDLEAAMAAAIDEAPAAAPPADAVQPDPPAEPEVAAADDEMMVPSNEGEQKSAEELLSEFEKMLG